MYNCMQTWHIRAGPQPTWMKCQEGREEDEEIKKQDGTSRKWEVEVAKTGDNQLAMERE